MNLLIALVILAAIVGAVVGGGAGAVVFAGIAAGAVLIELADRRLTNRGKRGRRR